MMVSIKTVVVFEMPQEYQQMVEYEKENPDWFKTESTIAVSFSKEQTYSVALKGGDDE